MEEFNEDMDRNEGNEEEMQRKPAVEKDIEEISKEDSRVSIIGKVFEIDKEDYTLLVDDQTDAISVEISGDAPEKDQIVRIIGRVIERDGSFVIQSEILQDFSDFDMEKYKRIKKLENEFKEVLEG